MRSRIGWVTVVILLLGALIAWPVYAFYGAWLLVVQFGLQLFALEAIIEIVQGLAVGVSAIFVVYFVIASLAILILQWRRR